MGYWKKNVIIIVVFFAVAPTWAGCPDAKCATSKKLRAALVRKGYSAEEIEQRITQAEVNARMKQAKWGMEYENSTPWWPEDPRYPVPYVFYRESPTGTGLQVDFGFNRW